MIRDGLASFKGRRVLLLQGPLGPFFRRLALDLTGVGAEVFKVDFNGGDLLFSPVDSIAYRGTLDQWPVFLEHLINTNRIDAILLFGDCRPMHRCVRELSRRLGIDLGVFEEGYVRPDYVTLERNGVNAHSRIPRAPWFYRQLPKFKLMPTHRVGNAFWHASAWAVLYYLASALLRPVFPHYVHHRPLALSECLPWARSLLRRGWFSWRERGMQAQLTTRLSGRYFLVPLQVHNDAQIHVHSPFDSVEGFIGSVLRSFAAHAPVDTHLVIKHHPMDRGYHDYTGTITRLEKKWGIDGRVHYIHDQHLPSLLDHARGVVLVNSTVGLSALHHGAPLKVCGAAIYDIQGLTYQGELDRFWEDAPSTTVDYDLYQRFIGHLVRRTQVNGSFYRRLGAVGAQAGLVWPSSLHASGGQGTRSDAGRAVPRVVRDKSVGKAVSS